MKYLPHPLQTAFPCSFTASSMEFCHALSPMSEAEHFHDCMELCLCSQGNATLNANETSFIIKPGDYCFIAEYTPHTLFSPSGCEIERIFFDPYLLFEGFLSEKTLESLMTALSARFCIITRQENIEAHFLLSCIFNEYKSKDSFYQESLRGLLISFLMMIAADNPASSLTTSDFSELYPALLYIRKHYRKGLSIPEIAEHCCGLSESHFRKKFKQAMDLSPLSYINLLRIRAACHLICDKGKNLSEIADIVGFPIISSFNRNFRNYLGCSPSEWRSKLT